MKYPKGQTGPAQTLKSLADCVGATLMGDPNCLIYGLAPLQSAVEGNLSFLTNSRYRHQLAATKASAVLLPRAQAAAWSSMRKEYDKEIDNVASSAENHSASCSKGNTAVSDEDNAHGGNSAEGNAACSWSGNILIVDNARLALAKIAGLFQCKKTLKPGIHPTAMVGEHCTIAPTACIGPYVVIGNNTTIEDGVEIQAGTILGDFCHIGKDTVLKPKSVLMDYIRIGQGCIIYSGAILGSDGFGFAEEKNRWVKTPHMGGVTIGDWVEVGANTTIDRGFLEDTLIAEGVIIDNQVQIAHNVQIGAYTAIAGCVGIGGSTKIGARCLIGGAVCIADNIEICDKVCLTAMSGLGSSINEPGIYSSGMPAKPNRQWRKNIARFLTIEEMAKKITALERAVELRKAKAET